MKINPIATMWMRKMIVSAREIFDPPCDCCPPYGPLKDEQPSAPIGFNEFGNPNDPADFYPSASDERMRDYLKRLRKEYRSIPMDIEMAELDSILNPSASDERDAEEYAFYPGCDGINGPGEGPSIDPIRKAAFLAGRNGMAPMSDLELVIAEATKAERERCAELITEQRKCYSEEIFTPIKPNEPDPIIRDRVSAQMARHVLDWAVEAILNPSEDGK